MTTMLLRIGAVGLSRCGGRKPSTLAQAAGHNLRAEQNERGARAHIDPSRTHENRILHGPDAPAKVVALAHSKMAAAGVDVAKLRRDYVQCIELLVGLPPGSGVAECEFFAAAVAWAGERYGAGNLLSAVVHKDEAAPHLHVLVLPLVGGKMCGKELKSAQVLQQTTRDFFEKVARRFGLRQPERVNHAQRAALARAVLARLEGTLDPCVRSVTWPAVRTAIEREPQPFAEALGVAPETKPKRLRTMAEIFTSRGKKTAEDRSHKAIAFDAGDNDAEGYIAFGGVKTPKATLCSLCPPQPPQNPEKRAIDSWPGPWRALGCRTAPAAPTAAPTAPTAAAPTAAAPTDRQQRLERARAAQARAIARHSAPEPVSPQTEAEDVRVVDRTDADPIFWD